MPVEYIGYRNLYDAIGCGLNEQEEFGVGFAVGECQRAEVYFGPRPRFGVWFDKSTDRYLVPEKGAMLGDISWARDPAELDYPSSFFCEISCFMAVEVSQDLSEAFHRKDEAAHNTFLNMAEEKGVEFKRTIELIAGVVGLKLHRQFVLETINEDPIALRLDGEDDFAHSHFGRTVELLEGIKLNQAGLIGIGRLLPVIGAANPEARNNAANVFRWLLRAWSQEDTVSTFISLFIPLEIILQGCTVEDHEDYREQAMAVESLIRQHGCDKKDMLLQYFNRLKGSWRPSLQARFESISREAEEAGFANCEADIEAFRKFNRIRNTLLHRGESNVELHVTVGHDETQGLEDLVERYVCYALFGNMDVYRSSWRGRAGKE